MKWYERVIDTFYKVLMVILMITIAWATLHFGKIAYNRVSEGIATFMNQEAQLEELYENDAWILATIIRLFGFQNSFNEAFVQDIVNIVKKPSYDYLSSVSVYLFRLQDRNGNDWKGSAGVGVIVAEKGRYKYILTNKHVCNWKSDGNCYIVIEPKDKTTWISLEYVNEAQSKYDLALWRTRDKIKGKRVIKGLSQEIDPQTPVYSVGHYLGSPFIYTEGTFAGYRGSYDVYNIPCAPGCSGSGIYGNDGKLVGLIFGASVIENRGGLGAQIDTAKVLAVPLAVIRLFLKNLV